MFSDFAIVVLIVIFIWDRVSLYCSDHPPLMCLPLSLPSAWVMGMCYHPHLSATIFTHKILIWWLHIVYLFSILTIDDCCRQDSDLPEMPFSDSRTWEYAYMQKSLLLWFSSGVEVRGISWIIWVDLMSSQRSLGAEGKNSNDRKGNVRPLTEVEG